MVEGIVFMLVASAWFVFRRRIAAYQVYLITEKFKVLAVRDKAENVGRAGVLALILFTLSSCAAQPASTGAVPSGSAAPCHGAYVADVDTSVPGEPTPEAAAVAWAKSVNAPSGAPTDGWKAVDERTARSGDWNAGVSRTIPGGWVVSGLGCGVTRS